jgi:O-acetyl-ADP-ribose deacetylase (regulator of RNase III)
MIYHVEGDILLSKAHVIAQGVSANDRMNHGLAKTLHEHFPPMHKAFHQWCHQHHPKTGEIWVWDALKNRLIVNLIIKEGGYNNTTNSHLKVDIHSIRHALHALKKRVAKDKFTSIALPRLATSAGELEWSEVLPVIEHELAELEIPVYLYSSYVPHQQAIEPSTH